jgi:hypothetical protein
MKYFSVLSSIALLAFLTGCATQRQLADLKGQGTRNVYAATFDQTWRAAVDAAQMGDLEVVTADRDHGYIGARRTIQPHTFGENVGIWVRQTGPSSTEVEVVSRQAGPPVLWVKNWENEIQRSIAANLTREAVGAPPREVIIERGAPPATVVVPENRETIVVPEKRETIVVPEKREVIVVPETAPTRESIRAEQRRMEELRIKQEAADRALVNEVDETKREMLQRQIDRLREDIKLQEKRLKDLERELK